MYDIVIIGAGVTGSLLARELSRYELSVLLLDKENDVGNVTSSANSAIVHSGYDPVPGTLKAKLNVLGCKMYPTLCEELDVSFGKCGTLTVVTNESQWGLFKDLVDRANANGAEIQTLSAEEVKKMEPNITKNVLGAIFAPEAGIVNPFEFVIHAAENAVDNGVELRLNTEVISIDKINDHFVVKTNNKDIETKSVINCAGLYADKIASMIEDVSWSITPRKGEYFILDHKMKGLVSRPIFPLPSEKGKGILVAPTTSGNYYLGPSSEVVEDKDDYGTDAPTLCNVRTQAFDLVDNIPMGDNIRVFSGLRATPSTHDFIIGFSDKYKEFINVAGIESPGFASSPAIANYVIDNFVKKLFPLKNKESFNPYVKKRVKVKTLSIEERNKLIKQNPEYGKIVCQCEQISLGEMKDELSRSVPPRSLKGMKRRVRSGFGKCQGGYCYPRVLEILCDYYKCDPTEVNYDSENTNVVIKKKVN